MMPRTKNCSPAMRKKVIELRAKNVPVKTIVKKTGLTKGQVSGIIWRDVKNKTPDKKPKNETAKKPKNTPNRLIKKPVFKPLPFLQKTYEPNRPVSMHKLTEFSCREVIGEPKNLLCCGEPTLIGCPYCARHAAINYQPRKENRI